MSHLGCGKAAAATHYPSGLRYLSMSDYHMSLYGIRRLDFESSVTGRGTNRMRKLELTCRSRLDDNFMDSLTGAMQHNHMINNNYPAHVDMPARDVRNALGTLVDSKVVHSLDATRRHTEPFDEPAKYPLPAMAPYEPLPRVTYSPPPPMPALEYKASPPVRPMEYQPPPPPPKEPKRVTMHTSLSYQQPYALAY